ncbi:MAG: hypothetical protein ACMUHB_02580 [Thermoplasmatota archaeon]
MEDPFLEREKKLCIGWGMAIGMLLGGAFGIFLCIATGASPVFISIGPGVGSASGISIGLALWDRRKRRCEGVVPQKFRVASLLSLVGASIIFMIGISLFLVISLI